MLCPSFLRQGGADHAVLRNNSGYAVRYFTMPKLFIVVFPSGLQFVVPECAVSNLSWKRASQP